MNVTHRRLCIRQDPPGLLLLLLELRGKCNLRSAEAEVLDVEGGYLGIEFFDAGAEGRVEPSPAACQNSCCTRRLVRSLRYVLVGKEEFLLDCEGGGAGAGA